MKEMITASGFEAVKELRFHSYCPVWVNFQTLFFIVTQSFSGKIKPCQGLVQILFGF
jgi:hypothetical protein